MYLVYFKMSKTSYIYEPREYMYNMNKYIFL
jgi:hypothetical protein